MVIFEGAREDCKNFKVLKSWSFGEVIQKNLEYKFRRTESKNIVYGWSWTWIFDIFKNITFLEKRSRKICVVRINKRISFDNCGWCSKKNRNFHTEEPENCVFGKVPSKSKKNSENWTEKHSVWSSWTEIIDIIMHSGSKSNF